MNTPKQGDYEAMSEENMKLEIDSYLSTHGVVDYKVITMKQEFYGEKGDFYIHFQYIDKRNDNTIEEAKIDFGANLSAGSSDLGEKLMKILKGEI